MREYALVVLVTAAVTYLLTPLVRRLAIAGGAIHAARDRDVHVVPIPLLGGLAIYAGGVYRTRGDCQAAHQRRQQVRDGRRDQHDQGVLTHSDHRAQARTAYDDAC